MAGKRPRFAAVELQIHRFYSLKRLECRELFAGEGKADQRDSCQRQYRKEDDRLLATQGYVEDIAVVTLLKACIKHKDLGKGSRIHADILRKGSFTRNIYIDSTLVDMYAKCGELLTAQHVFNDLSSQTVVCWNALIAGYAQNGYGEEALSCFEQMLENELTPNATTLTCTLKACGRVGALQKGKKVHVEIERQGYLTKNTVLGNALIDMYAKCGALADAEHVFQQLPVRNIVSWTTLIAAYCESQQGEKALNCYEEVKGEGLPPDVITFASILKVCGSIGASEKGKEIHVEIVRVGLLHNFTMLGNALVDMYGKCGELAKAQETFDKLDIQSIVSWTALIATYAHFGRPDFVFSLLHQMVGAGMEPSLVTNSVVLNAYSYLGLVNEGQMYFETISGSFGMVPNPSYYVVNFLGHEGYFDKAMTVIEKMPWSNRLLAWFALLGACQTSGNLKFGKVIFEHAVSASVQVNDAKAKALI